MPDMTNNDDGLMTPQEAADFLGISRPKLYQLADAGKIAIGRLGKLRYVTHAEVKRFLEEKRAVLDEKLGQLKIAS